MKKFNLFTILFAIASIVFFAGCDDNDKKDSNNQPAEECKCDDGTTCPEAGKDACVKPETDKCNPACPEGKECKCVEDACDCADVNPPAPVCDPACDEATQDCVCAEDKCECKTKDTPVEDCFCDDAKTVKCPAGGKDACPDPSAPEDACKDKSENDACGENKTCQKADGDKLECKDKPAAE